VKLQDNNNMLLKKLSDILSSSDDPVVLAVAAHDIGAYIREVPTGRKLMTQLGTKQRIMELMGHRDPDVRYEALSTTQLFLSHAWNT
jgi:V-type H+-transporting ATPase subunit H